MFDFSPIQILMVLGIALLVMGPSRLPGMAQNLGKGLRDFKRSLGGDGPDLGEESMAKAVDAGTAVATSDK